MIKLKGTALTDLFEAFRNVHLFADLPPAAIDQLVAAARTATIQSGEFLFQEGDAAHVFFVLVKGRMRLIQHSLEGKDVTLATFVPGDVMAVIVALTGDPYPGSGEALEDCEVARLSSGVLWPLIADCPALAFRLLQITAARLHEAQQRIRELSVERVEQRIARSLLRLVQQVGIQEAEGAIRIDMRLSRQDLAQMNGTTLESVSRTLNAWERERIVDVGREWVTILKPGMLSELADGLAHIANERI